MNGEYKIKPSQVAYLLENYGPDFFAKCKHYKTARRALNDSLCCALIKFYPEDLTFDVRWAFKNEICRISLFELDNFVL